jgi:sugar diacid utilization regulator
MQPPRTWDVLLIGGASGVGKTSVSYRIAQHYGVGITEVDDFQVILERITTPEQQPILHYWRTHHDEALRMSEDQQLAFMIAYSQVMATALDLVIGNHLASNAPIVLEGDFILPSLAIQPATTIGDWQRSYHEAVQTLALGQRLFGPYSLTAFRDLHIYRLLFELRFSPELWRFYHATLGTLIEYDREHRSALIETLEAYFATQGNLMQASERLHIHRNTLLYRLRRISQLNGINLECAEEMLALQVALKAHRVLHTMPEPPSVKPGSATERAIAAPDQPATSSFGFERFSALSEIVVPRNGSTPK